METDTLTVAQQDTLVTLARRLHVASLAINALGADLVHDAVAGTVLDVAYELETFTARPAARASLSLVK